MIEVTQAPPVLRDETWSSSATTAPSEFLDSPYEFEEIDQAKSKGYSNAVVFLQTPINTPFRWYHAFQEIVLYGAYYRALAEPVVNYFVSDEEQVEQEISWQITEPDPREWRGVFSLTYKPKVLFSKRIEIRTSELPRWKPRITIDRRALEREDD